MKIVIERVIYILVYPAILGSMIYDVSDVNLYRTESIPQVAVLLLFVAIYILDYATNNGASKPLGEGANKPAGMLADFFVAIGLRASFSLANDDLFFGAHCALIFVLIIVLAFQTTKNQVFSFETLAVCLIVVGLLFFPSWPDILTSFNKLLISEIIVFIGYLGYAMKQKKSPAS